MIDAVSIADFDDRKDLEIFSEYNSIIRDSEPEFVSPLQRLHDAFAGQGVALDLGLDPRGCLWRDLSQSTVRLGALGDRFHGLI